MADPNETRSEPMHIVAVSLVAIIVIYAIYLLL
jgi:hypothetical protein